MSRELEASLQLVSQTRRKWWGLWRPSAQCLGTFRQLLGHTSREFNEA